MRIGSFKELHPKDKAFLTGIGAMIVVSLTGGIFSLLGLGSVYKSAWRFISIALAVFLAYCLIHWKYLFLKSRFWPVITGQVVEAGILPSVGPLIKVQYEVGDRSYIHEDVPECCDTPTEADEALARYPKGTLITLRYNPSNPSETFPEEKHPILQLLVGFGVIVIFLCAGIWGE